MKTRRIIGRATFTRPRFSFSCASALSILAAAGCGAPGDEGFETIVGPSICGSTTDWQNVETYDGTLGPTTDFVAAHQRPVGQMTPIGCSGTLIAPDLFLTAGHCASSSTPGNQTVRFNFQSAPNGTPRPTTSYSIAAVVEDALGGVDYAILRLNGNPGGTWGTTVPTALRPTAGQPITIIQHPNGLPKKVEGGTLDFFADGRMTYGNLDTEGGTSGSGILQNRTGSLIGVHTEGTSDDSCSASDPNSGESIDSIMPHSPTMRRIAVDAAKVVGSMMPI